MLLLLLSIGETYGPSLPTPLSPEHALPRMECDMVGGAIRWPQRDKYKTLSLPLCINGSLPLMGPLGPTPALLQTCVQGDSWGWTQAGKIVVRDAASEILPPPAPAHPATPLSLHLCSSGVSRKPWCAHSQNLWPFVSMAPKHTMAAQLLQHHSGT